MKIYRKKRAGRRKLGRRTYRVMRRIAASQILKKAETKNTVLAHEGVDLYHNGQISVLNLQPDSDAQFWNIWSTTIVPGTGYNNRVGTEIMPRGMSIRMYFENEALRPNVHYRLIIGIAPKLLADGLTPSNYDNLQLFQGIGSNLVRHVDTEKGYKILYDRIYRVEQGFTGWAGGAGPFRCHKFLKIWLRRKRGSKITYVASNAGVASAINNKPVFMCIIPYDSDNTLPTDHIGNVTWQAKLYWKDV